MNCIEDPKSMPQDSKEEEGGEGAAQAEEEGNEASVPPVSEAEADVDEVEKARPKPKPKPVSSYQKKVKKNLVPCAYGPQTSCAGSGKILGGGTHGKYRYMCLVCRGQWQQQPPHRLKEGEVLVITFCDGISNKQKREIGATLKEEKKRRKEEEAVSLAESERVSLVPQDPAGSSGSPKDAQAFHNSKVVERNKENARRVAQQRKILEENEKERIRALEAKRLEDYRRAKEEEMARKEEERRRKAEEKAEARRKQKVVSLPSLPPLAPLPSPLSTDFSDLPPPPSSLSMKMRSKHEREEEREGPSNAAVTTQTSQASPSTPPPFIDMLFSSVCTTYKLDHGTWVFCPPLIIQPDTAARQVDATACAC